VALGVVGASPGTTSGPDFLSCGSPHRARSVLDTAENVARKPREEAHDEAQRLIAEAREEAERIRVEARGDAPELQRANEQLLVEQQRALDVVRRCATSSAPRWRPIRREAKVRQLEVVLPAAQPKVEALS